MRAACLPSICTVAAPGGMMAIPLGAWGRAAGVVCGTGHMILSPTRAAGWPLIWFLPAARADSYGGSRIVDETGPK
jgi:hypothetical protein